MTGGAVEFKILGPLVVRSPAGEVKVAGSRRRALLVRLLVVPNQLVAAPRLAEDLWEGEPPASWVSTLQSHVSLLRRVLGPGRIEGRDGGYVISAADDEIDSRLFEIESGQGRHALEGGDPREAAGLLRQALDRFNGPALVDVSEAAWALSEASRLEELRLNTLELWLDARLALGEHSEVVATAQAAVAEHQLRERLWGQLILALYRSGRQADALRAYQRLRTTLGDELGIGPSAELVALEQAVILQRPEMDWREGTGSSPRSPFTAQTPDGTFGEGQAVPMPARLLTGPEYGLVGRAVGVVGRETELTAMTDATKRVSGGGGREILLISGEAGLGKTTLLAEAARAAFDYGVCVLFGHCEEDLATPYQLFAEALGHFVTHATEEQLAAHTEAHGSELSRLVPRLAHRIRDLPPSKATDADTERYLLFEAVVGLFSMLSAQLPVVLVLDDLQWADKGSLHLLRHLVAAEQQMRVLVLGAYRDTELSRTHPLLETLGALRRQNGVSRIELTGLDDTGVISFMEAAAGQTLDADGVDLAHAVHRETDGNPFFLSEVLRHLVETRAIYRDTAGQWVKDDSLEAVGLPAGVREVIGARVGRLGASSERVLSFAAVIGRDFDFEVLAEATETREDELLEVLDAARSAALVREMQDAPGHYSFAHALIQHTLYEDLGPTRQARVHRRVAEALEDLSQGRPGRRVGELARHWFKATQPKDLAKAIEYSRQAADAALAALAPGEALRYYSQALDLFAEADDSEPLLDIDLRIGLGTAQRQSGDPAYRDTLLDAARGAARLDDTERLIAAVLANDRGFFSALGTIDDEKVAILETTLDRLSPTHPDRALVLANLSKELAVGTSLERRRTLADEAVALAEMLGNDATIVRVLNHVAVPLLVPPLLEQSLSRSAEALVRAERVGDPALMFWAATVRRIVAACGQDVEELDRCFEIAGAQAEQLNQPTLNWVQTFGRASRALVAGDPDGAEQLATEALQIGTDGGEPDVTTVFGPQLIGVQFERGTLGAFIGLIEQNVAQFPGVPAFVAALALAHVESDNPDAARPILEQFAAKGFDLPFDIVWLTAMALYAEAAIECRDPEFAWPLLERLAPWANRLIYDAGTSAGPVSHYLGGLAAVLGRDDEAEMYFAQSSTFSEQVGAKWSAARTEFSWGRMLAERRGPGDTEKARTLLAKAHAAAVTHGYGTVERRADLTLQLLDA